MDNNVILFNLFKEITNYEIIIGGMAFPPDMEKGSLIINYINTIELSKSNKSKPIKDGEILKIKEYSLQQTLLQIDFYRVNPLNLNYIDCMQEALKVKEWLKSYQIQSYLKDLDIEILPNIGTITYLTDFTEQKKLVNRAFFEVNLIHKSVQVEEQLQNIENVKFINKIILQENKG